MFRPHVNVFFTLFQFLTRLLTSKLLKLFSTYIRGRNGTMRKKGFSAPQKSAETKTKCVTDFLLTVRFRV